MSLSRLTIQMISRHIHGIRTAVTLAGRPFLPGSLGKDFPKYLAEPVKDFPHIIEADDVRTTKKECVSDFSKAIR